MKKKLLTYAAMATLFAGGALGLSAESKAFTLIEIMVVTGVTGSGTPSQITYSNPSSSEISINFKDKSGVTYTGTADFSDVTVRDGMAYYSFPVTITGR